VDRTAERLRAERDLGPEVRSPSCRAVDAESTSERLDTVGQTPEARSASRVGAAATIVLDRDPGPTVTRRHGHRDPGRAGVLRDVRERLRADEVRDRLNVRRELWHGGQHLHGHRSLLGERRKRVGKPRLGENSRMQAVREPLELLQCAFEVSLGRGDAVPRHLGGGGQPDGAQSLREPLQPLLRTRAKPPLQAPALLDARLDEPPPRLLQLRHLRAHLRGEARIRGGQPRGRRDRLAEAWIVQHGAVVHECRDRTRLTLDERGRALAVRAGKGDRTVLGVDEDIPAREPVADLEARVGERPRELVAKRPTPVRAKLDYEVGDRAVLPRT
jgi:hypothetical protein